jgi:hypothetical protein
MTIDLSHRMRWLREVHLGYTSVEPGISGEVR